MYGGIEHRQLVRVLMRIPPARPLSPCYLEMVRTDGLDTHGSRLRRLCGGVLDDAPGIQNGSGGVVHGLISTSAACLALMRSRHPCMRLRATHFSGFAHAGVPTSDRVMPAVRVELAGSGCDPDRDQRAPAGEASSYASAQAQSRRFGPTYP